MTSAKTQGGYALLLFVVILMGVSGGMFGGYLKDARQESNEQRYLHNQRVLKEAKRALLMYAYNYPATALAATGNIRGPGRLPCPDTDNDGIQDTSFDCDNGGAMVGRFPWNAANMNFYDARDASGERLWYAVSEDFANSQNGPDQINNATLGSITIHDQGGDLMYDGSVAGIAAVIIAPGAPIGRNGVAQDREITNGDIRFDTVADTDPGITNANNYLDLFGALDNADFVNFDAANGFVLGPVRDATGGIIVNDQIILVTAAELRAVAQKAALDAYRDALNDYLVDTGGVYPWLNGYDAITDPITVYNVPPGRNIGRVPLMNYFEDDTSNTLVTSLEFDYTIDLNLTDSGATYINSFSNFFAGTQNMDISAASLSFTQQAFGGGSTSRTDGLGTMIVRSGVGTVLNGPASFTPRQFYWDGTGSPLPEDGWELCPVNFGDERDCAKDPSAPYNFVTFVGPPAPDPSSNWGPYVTIKIRVVDLTFTFGADFEVGFAYGALPATAPVYVAATAGGNARVTRDLDGSVTNISIGVPSSVNASQNFIQVTVDMCEQDDGVGNKFNAFYLGNSDGGSVDCEVTPPILSTNLTAAVPIANLLDFEADYHPPLPIWVRRNNWNDSIMLAYGEDHKPGLGNDCENNAPCLTLEHSFQGSVNNKISLLVGGSGLPADSAGMEALFEGDNNVPDEQRNATPEDWVFDFRPTGGDDVVLVINEF